VFLIVFLLIKKFYSSTHRCSAFNQRFTDQVKAPSIRQADRFSNFQGNLIMNRSYFSAITLAVAALAAGNAMAADASAPKTREQVKAELAEAIRTGDIVVNGETQQKANEVNPGLYPAKPVLQGKTREEVKAELAEAIRTGDIVVGEGGEKANELYPSRYPAKPVMQGKTREQVKTELAEAIRTGHMPVIAY
jgi:predicted RNase H-like HicB family nuclease